MKTETIGLYLTKTGKEAMRITKRTFNSGSVVYSYIGTIGAGCPDLQTIKNNVNWMLANKRGIQTVIAI